MIALEVSVNGRKVALAGAEDLVVLHAIVNAVGKLGANARGTKHEPRGHELFLSVGGLSSPKDRSPAKHVRWGRSGQTALAIGDEILVRIVRAKAASRPTARYSADVTSARARREQFEWAKKLYLAEREEYEGTRSAKAAPVARAAAKKQKVSPARRKKP